MVAASNALPIAQAWYMRTWREFRMEIPQVHNRLEIMYVLSGTCVMGVGREPYQPFPGKDGKTPEPEISERRIMKRGDFLLVDALVPHTLVTAPDGDCRMLNLEYAWLPASSSSATSHFSHSHSSNCSSPTDGMANEIGNDTANDAVNDRSYDRSNDTTNDTTKGYAGRQYPGLHTQAAGTPEFAELLARKPPFLFLKDTQDIGTLLRSLVLELDGGAAPEEWFAQSLFFALHVRISRLLSETERFRQDAGQRYVSDALQYMRTNYDREIRITEVASAVNVHPAYLQRLFRKTRGLTMIAWLNRYRMEQAKMLLLTTDLPLADLCGYVGMNSRQHFSAIFREHVGISPAEFRRSTSMTRFVGKGDAG